MLIAAYCCLLLLIATYCCLFAAYLLLIGPCLLLLIAAYWCLLLLIAAYCFLFAAYWSLLIAAYCCLLLLIAAYLLLIGPYWCHRRTKIGLHNWLYKHVGNRYQSIRDCTRVPFFFWVLQEWSELAQEFHRRFQGPPRIFPSGKDLRNVSAFISQHLIAMPRARPGAVDYPGRGAQS